MAEHAANAASDIPAAKGGKGRSKKKLLLIAAPVLLLGGGAGAYFAGVIPGTGATHATPADKPNEKPAVADPSKAGGQGAVFFDIPDQLVNLNSAGRKTAFLKVSISLELENKEDIPKVTAVLPRIVDNFQTYMRELKIEDLRGSAGLYRLREELLVRVNAAASPVKINDVLFREMLVQ